MARRRLDRCKRCLSVKEHCDYLAKEDKQCCEECEHPVVNAGKEK